jgi:NADH-quinone oxidoreductase subunit D
MSHEVEEAKVEIKAPRQPSELDAPLMSKMMTLNLGPSHPATHGVTKAVAQLDGETLKDLKIEIGFLHRGFEKSCENVTWTQVFPYTDRLNYVSSINNNVGYALAVEKLCGIEAPERAQYLRVITAELHRLCDHLTLVGATGLELGAMTVVIFAVEGRDLLWDRLNELTGARLTSNYCRVGGVTRDLPEGWIEKTLRVLDRCVEIREEVNALLTRNRIFVDRVKNVGKISRADAIDYGFTGPCLRAAGEPYDIRKANPYLIYDRLDFDVPVGSNGDTFDRYLIRIEEMKQSDKMIRQCFKQMAPGDISLKDYRFVLPPKPEVYGTIEGAMAHFKIIMEGIKVPAGEAYASTEAPNGELGFYLVSDGSGRPYKMGLRCPTWGPMSALPFLTVGGLLADLIPVYDSINYIAGEVEQ